ncbi:MAG: putative Ig domain-containing protein, partial [Brevundimonas sp.]
MTNPDIKIMADALGRLVRAHGVWVALVLGLLFAAAPGDARAQATCAIDFSVSYNAVNYQHVMSMTSNFDEFAACDPRYVANPGDPASGFTPYVQSGSTVNGGSFVTAVNAADNTISYTAPTGFSGTDTFTVYFCNDAGCSGAAARVGTVTVTVGTPTIVVNPVTLPAATVASAYSQTLTGAGGQAPYGSFTVISGGLPAGLSLSAGGALTGTPTASGSFNFTIRT